MGQRVWKRSAGWKLPLKQKKEALRTGTRRSQARKEGREGLIARGHREAGNQVTTVSEDKGTEEEDPVDACSGRVKGRGGQVGMVVERAAGDFKTHGGLCAEGRTERGKKEEGASLWEGGTEEPGAGVRCPWCGGCDGACQRVGRQEWRGFPPVDAGCPGGVCMCVC